MTATRARRIVPLLVATLLTGGGISLASTAVAAPATTAASVTTDIDDDNMRTVERLTPQKPRAVKKVIRRVWKYGVDPGNSQYGGGNVDEHTWAREYRTPCAELDCLQN
ncbi:hypothetical protein [Streptomyces virginiae]|uniref:hypothetical protein n=1 Tax=Streptomyces virginiae TaxID=1961 RepID=UPI0004C83AF1|nr:hypothetical protein [Streptomyces virginiae]